MQMADIRTALLAMDNEKLEQSHLEAFAKFAPSDEEVRCGKGICPA